MSRTVRKSVRLTEAQIKGVIEESVKQVLSELDWKTYANAAKKRLQQYRDSDGDKRLWDKYCDLENAANRRFDDDYVGDMKYGRMGDNLAGKRSAVFNSHLDLGREGMPYGAVRGRNKGGDEIFSTGKRKYHSSRGIDSPRNFFRDKDVADRFSKANDELWDYNDGNYEYVKGQGWRLKR